MGLTPTTPDLSQISKSFWDRREGTTGKLIAGVFVAGVGVALFIGWGAVLPFLIGVMGNTVQLAMLVAALMAITSPIWSQRVRFIGGLAFQQTCRWITQRFVEIDPIGILRENIKQIREQVAEFSKAVQAIAGNRQRVIDDIAKQKGGIMKNKSLVQSVDAEIAKKQAALQRLTDPQQIQEAELTINRMNLTRQGYGRMAGAQLTALKRETPALESLNALYDQLCRIRDLGQYRAEALSQEADIEAQTHALMTSVKSAIRSGSKMLQRDPNQTALYEQAIEYLNNDASDTLGAMSDFNRWAERSLTDMDIQNGAQAQEAFQMFADMEKKLKAPVVAARDVKEIKQVDGKQVQIATPHQDSLPAPDSDFAIPDFDSAEIQKLLK